MKQEDIDRILKSLSPDNRRIAELRFGGNTLKEIAKIINIGYSTILNKHNPQILEAFGVEKWEEIEGSKPPNSEKKKISWVLFLTIPGVVLVLAMGWIMGSRFPWSIAQIPTPTSTSTPTPTPTSTLTPTSTPYLGGTLSVAVRKTITAIALTKLAETPVIETITTEQSPSGKGGGGGIYPGFLNSLPKSTLSQLETEYPETVEAIRRTEQAIRNLTAVPAEVPTTGGQEGGFPILALLGVVSLIASLVMVARLLIGRFKRKRET